MEYNFVFLLHKCTDNSGISAERKRFSRSQYHKKAERQNWVKQNGLF